MYKRQRFWYKVQILDGEGQVLAETAQPYQIPYYNELRNGDFESPEILNRQSYQPFYDSGANGVVWKTTAKSGKIEFVSADKKKLDGNSGLTHQEQSIQWHKVEAAADVSGGGTQFAELNANESGALYQDVLTTPGATLYWQLSHRARGADSDKYQSGAEDTMYVLIMSTELAEKYNVTTQDKEMCIRDRSYAPDLSVAETSGQNVLDPVLVEQLEALPEEMCIRDRP